MNTPITLSIAGSDSSGGAGIQADIKAISATGGYACTVITALTAQNTQGVSGIFPVPITFLESQLDAVFTDLAVKAVKIGMLADSDVIKTVARKLQQYRPPWVVLDPVMVATSGDTLLNHDAIDTLINELIPLADLVTPNLPEMAALLGCDMPETFDFLHNTLMPNEIGQNQSRQNQRIQNQAASNEVMQKMVSACRALSERSSGQSKFPAFLLKGGHLVNDEYSRDLLVMKNVVQEFSAPRIITKNTHGTGCTLSSAIASYLAQGRTMPQAISEAKSYLTQALMHADTLKIGHGHGPVSHFYMLSAP